MDFGCNVWADCSCAKGGGKCGCGSGCGCGSIKVSEVKSVMEKECPWADCKCGSADCGCGKDCQCNGGTKKGKEDWVAMTKKLKEKGKI